EERDERRGAQREEPRAPDGDRLVGERAPERGEAAPRLEKLEKSLHASRSARPPETTSGWRASGFGGGPASTAPEGPYTPPWQGQRNAFRVAFQETPQPRWLHVVPSATRPEAALVSRTIANRSFTRRVM